MNVVTRLLVVTVAGWMALQMAASAAPVWLDDFSAAQALARKEKKLILMNFTGSDWCSWCGKLRAEVFATEEFDQFARANLVLMEVDFPNAVPQAQKLKSANEALQKKYKAEGYPTILVLDKDGKEVWRQAGYMAGGPSAWIGKLKTLK
jgi:thioredoxin-related protein